MRLKKITTAEIEYTAFTFAKRLMTWNEPIPEFGTRFPNILESSIETPFLRFNNRDLYRGLTGKASILFYLLIKNHPFQNGNKRIAVMSLLYFLGKNDKWVGISNDELYKFAKDVAKSHPENKESVIIQIQETLKKHLIDFEAVIS